LVLLKTDVEADWIVEMRRIMEEHWAMDLASAKTEELAALFFPCQNTQSRTKAQGFAFI
jgi:hypothetical protein